MSGQAELFGGLGDAAEREDGVERGWPVPLAARMRPRNLDEVVGQAAIVGAGSLLRRLVESGQFGSLLLQGPPGCGKTSLAEAIAAVVQARCIRVNAVTSNTAEIREILGWARMRRGERVLVLIDEIHRFNKAQQDLLLPDVEAGVIRLIGATTHNPGFYINGPLLSRSHLFRLEPLAVEAIVAVLERALADEERGLGAHAVRAQAGVLASLAKLSNGDLRFALNGLETLVLGLPVGGVLGEAALETFVSERKLRYDRDGDEHYDTASAYIKSMRGGDADAALYWLVKLLDGGEDPRFIARRLMIFASEDIGLADARALSMAVACAEACERVGLPECQLTLAHVTAFMAMAPKSNATTVALGRVQRSQRKNGTQLVPQWLRDAHTHYNRAQGQGAGYQYSHEYEEAISGQAYMLEPEAYLELGTAGEEPRIAERLRRWAALRRAGGKKR